jgi:hypothetical protein
MSRKTLIIIAAALGLILMALLGYYFFLRTIPSGSTENPTGFNLFPLGGTGGTNNGAGSGEENTEPGTTTTSGPEAKLRKLSTEPVSGAGTLDFKAGTVVRYIEKGTGHIFEVELFSTNQNRISNTTIPLIYDALWGNKNTSAIVRYLKEDNQTIDTYSLTLKNVSTTTENAVSAVALPTNISDISVFGTSIFYLQQNPDASSGIIANFSGGGKKQIWSSPIKELNSQYVNARIVALTTKPAQNIPGFLYFVNTSTGSVTNILGNIPGLSALTNPDATRVLYVTQDDNLTMSVLDQNTKANLAFSPAAFPEKCVWSTKDKNIFYCAVAREGVDGRSLTLWYQGFASFTDDIWKYDIKNNTTSVVESLSEDAGTAIDVYKPILSENEKYIIFMNRRDNSLWSLDLSI